VRKTIDAHGGPQGCWRCTATARSTALGWAEVNTGPDALSAGGLRGMHPGIQRAGGASRLLVASDDAKRLIALWGPEEIRNLAIQQGMTTLLQDGIWKTFRGRTDLKTVMRSLTATDVADIIQRFLEGTSPDPWEWDDFISVPLAGSSLGQRSTTVRRGSRRVPACHTRDLLWPRGRGGTEVLDRGVA